MADAPRGGLGPRINLREWRAGVFLTLAAVATATATSVPWNWRFPVLYLVAGFVLRLVIRTKYQDLTSTVPLAVLAGTLGVAVRTIYGSAWLPTNGVAHVGSLYALAILSGFVLAEWVRPVNDAR